MKKTPRISRTLTYDESALKRRQDAISTSSSRYKTATDLEIRRMRPLILKDMKLKPRHSTSIMFVWSNDPAANARARGWYFANMVPPGSKGGVYQRTGALEKNTKVIGSATRTNGEITIEVKGRGAEYVFGVRQIPSHARSGHPRLAEVADKWGPIASRRLGEIWLTVASPTAGIGE